MTNIASSVTFASVRGQAPDSPLDVPEILMEISSYLSPRDVHSCLHVNRNFHTTFASVFWRYVQLGPNRRAAFVTLNSVRSHAHQVQSLIVTWDPTLFCGPYLSLNFAVLNELQIKAQIPKRPLRSYSLDKEPATFLLRHRSMIRTLTVSNYIFGSNTLTFWKNAAQLQALSTLELDNITLNGEVVGDLVLKVFATLQSLQLARVHFTNLKPSVLLDSESDLKKIELQGCFFDFDSLRAICRLLKISGALRVLVWGPWTMLRKKGQAPGSSAPLTGILSQGLPWNDLKRLDVCRLEGVRVKNMFEALTPGVPELTLYQISLSKEAKVALLGSFAGKLTRVNLEFCEGLESATVHDLLCSCNNLLSVSVDTPLLASSVMQSSAPWVCRQLQEWKISIEMDEGEGDDDERAGAHHMFERLSQLEQLRVLNVSSTYARLGEDVFFLTFREDQGVRCLSSLLQMKVLNVRHTRQEVGGGDWRWLLQTFRGLRSVVGLRVASGEEVAWQAALARRAIAYSR
ncbi:hypothetical protein EMPS_06604 [Entomortierella parvispora]|uniref:F-box domain-containing protein n=1 Tax=Entomortierella parvispora TaxID=205924 RepID=A0A9P3LXD9_9FUNG|nr:hypothetical protein EMPS_06604 [Entomortierella parvispora]